MKKKFVLVLMIIFCMVMFAGCRKTQVVGECESCHKEAPLYIFDLKEKGKDDDQKDYVCKDCGDLLVKAAEYVRTADPDKYDYIFKEYVK